MPYDYTCEKCGELVKGGEYHICPYSKFPHMTPYLTSLDPVTVEYDYHEVLESIAVALEDILKELKYQREI